MVNVIVGLTNVLSSTFAKDSGKVVNKLQMLIKEHVLVATHSVTLAKEKDANIDGGESSIHRYKLFFIFNYLDINNFCLTYDFCMHDIALAFTLTFTFYTITLKSEIVG